MDESTSKLRGEARSEDHSHSVALTKRRNSALFTTHRRKSSPPLPLPATSPEKGLPHFHGDDEPAEACDATRGVFADNQK
jgi:hypothetical protein